MIVRKPLNLTAEQEQLVQQNEGLAFYVANKFRSSGVDQEDLRQIARLAMCRAAQLYEPSRGSYGNLAVESAIRLICQYVVVDKRRRQQTTLGATHGTMGTPRRAVEERAQAAEVWQRLDEFVDTRTALILRRKSRGESLREIADSIGLSRQRVQRLYEEGLDLLRWRVLRGRCA